MNLEKLPENLPVPVDDGAADHLETQHFPDISFRATNGEQTSPYRLGGLVVLYVYPLTGHPDTPLPDGWDDIPGARGCTPQSCGFRDHYSDLLALKTHVFGLSTQTTDYQAEAKERLQLPFDMLSDSGLSLKDLLKLPTFEVDGTELYKRISLILRDGIICKVFYPVFPPGENADQVISWLRKHS